DLFKAVPSQKYDVIISNPPYIGKEEWTEMDQSVRLYEPELALFAANSGYALYEKIAQESPRYLAENGQLFLEIGYRQGSYLCQLFQQAFPTKQVECLKD